MVYVLSGFTDGSAWPTAEVFQSPAQLLPYLTGVVGVLPGPAASLAATAVAAVQGQAACFAYEEPGNSAGVSWGFCLARFNLASQ